MSETARRATRRFTIATVPPLHDLQYEQCGYNVPAVFTPHFLKLHEMDWETAERDWQDIVALVLNTDAVDRRATGGTAVRQAVEAAAALLTDEQEWPWCPICGRRTEREESNDGH